MNLQQQRISALCEELKLPALSSEWSALAQRTADAQGSFADFLTSLLESEQAARTERIRNTLLKLATLPTVRKSTVLREDKVASSIRAFPQPNCHNGDLARSISDLGLKQGWRVEELHTEEGRLDEVFRSITLSDTIQEERK